ncbi:MAG: hypothetical protein ABSG57_11800 [Candidatus Bathyarchaeia archaeon]|jgi:hypothetical protein
MPTKPKKEKSFADLVSDTWRGKPRTREIAVSKSMRTLADGRKVPVKAHIREIEQK